MCLRHYWYRALGVHTPGVNGQRSTASLTFSAASVQAAHNPWTQLANYLCQVSDDSGFGTGGTSTAVTVLEGQDGCFDPTEQVQAPWFFHTTPDRVLTTCETSRIWWNDGDPQGYVKPLRFIQTFC